jgi:hypothetical protein
MPPKKTKSKLDQEIGAALSNKATIQKLVEKWEKAAAFNYAQASADPDDAPYRQGYAAAAEQIARDLRALL